MVIDFPTKSLSDYSSAGRAGDCSIVKKSLGPWFDSGWSDFFSLPFILVYLFFFFHGGVPWRTEMFFSANTCPNRSKIVVPRNLKKEEKPTKYLEESCCFLPQGRSVF